MHVNYDVLFFENYEDKPTILQDSVN